MVDGLNVIDKQYMYQLMSTVQLSVLKTFDSHILMHSCTPKHYVSLSKEFQKYLSKDDRKHGVVDQGKDRKRASKIKCTYREYHVQDNADVAQKYVNIYCDTNQFPALPFCGSHPKPHGSKRI